MVAPAVSAQTSRIEGMTRTRRFVLLVLAALGTSIYTTAHRLEKNPLSGGAHFNHFRPARLFAERAGALK
jgi:hypothetical protein